MSEHPIVHESDPLRELTRKERRTLLVVSVLAIAIVEGGLVPTKIPALGIELKSNSQDSLIYLIGAVVLYYLIVFLIYAYHDFTSWKTAKADAYMTKVMNRETIVDVPPAVRSQLDKALNNYNAWVLRERRSFEVRRLVDFGIPPIVALIALFLLVRNVWCT